MTPSGKLSRRALLAGLVGTTGLALLAACGPSSQPAAPTDGPPPGVTRATPPPSGPGALATTAPAAGAAPKPTTAPAQAAPAAAGAGAGKEYHGAWPFEVPPAGHFNSFEAKSIFGFTPTLYWDFFEAPLAIWRWADAKWEYVLAQDSKIVPPDQINLNLRSGLKWSDGAPFTAKDVATTFWIARLENATVWRYIDRVDAPSDTAVNFHFAKPSSVGERLILRERMRPNSVYGEWAQKLQDLVSGGKNADSDEWKKLRTDFGQFRPKEPLSVGPYKIDPASITEAQLTMVKNPGGFAADKVKFDKLVIYNGETPQVTPLVLAGDVDYATHGFPPATEKAFIDQGVRIIRGPAYSGPALFIHWEKAPQFQDKRVRQAVAHAVNRDENGKVSLGESGKAVQFMSGISDALVPQWISEEGRGKLNKYEFDLAKADGLMKEAGFAKGSDGIYAKDGQKMEFELIVPSDFADWSAAAQHLAESLTKFGIKVDVRGVVSSQHIVDVNDGKFTLAIRAWGIANPHVQASYTQDLLTHNTIPANGGMKYPLKQETSSGPVDFDALITASGEGLDMNPQKDAVTKMALAYNELLPQIPLWERYGNNPILEGKRVTGWPKEGDPIYQNAFTVDSFVTLMMFDGTLKPA
jgi:peptide/nickel transport system substrate-binding protein